MTGTALVIFLLNFVGSSIAFRMNLSAWRVSVEPFRRRLFGSITILALLYIVSYAWVILGFVSILQWSSIMRWVSLLAWLIVWVAPAWARVYRVVGLEQDIIDHTVASFVETLTQSSDKSYEHSQQVFDFTQSPSI